MSLQQRGQAAVEYLFVLVFMVLISVTIIKKFNEFFNESLGNLGHAISLNLLVGICDRSCYFGGYKNGFGP